MTPHQPHAFAKLASPCLIRQLIMRRGWVIGGAGILVLVALMGWSRWRGEAVSVLQVQQRPLEQWVVASGQVRSQSLARMGAEITGTVAQRHVREGDQVAAGDLLISLQADDWQAQLQQAQTALDQLRNQLYPQAVHTLQEARLAWQQSEREAQRRMQLAKDDMLATEQAEQAELQAKIRKATLKRAELAEHALKPGGDEERLLQHKLELARASLAKTRIHAPFAGRVQTRNVEPGDQVQPGKVLLEIARLDDLEVVAAVDEKYMAPLALEQRAVVIADAWPQQELQAQVSFLAPAVDEAGGTLDVHLQVDDPQRLLRQGMTVSVSVLTASKPQAWVVPRDYLQQQSVWRLQDGRLQQVPVTIGLQTSTQVEVLSGLHGGDWLVLPHQRLQQGARLRVGQIISHD